MQAASRPGRRWRRFCPSWRPAAGSRFRSAATWPPFCRVLPTFPFIVLLTLPLRRGLPGSSSTPLFELRSQLLDLCPFRRRRTTHTCSSFTLLFHHQIHSWNRWFPLTLTFNLLQGERRFPAEDQGGDVDVGIDDNADHFAAGRFWARRLRTSRTVETTSASVNPRSSALGRPYAFMLSHHCVRSYCRSASRTSSLIVRCSFRAISSARVSISGGRVIESVFDVRIVSLYRNA